MIQTPSANFMFLLLSSILSLGWARPGKLILSEDGVEMEINTKECNSGVFFQKPTSFQWARITGVWAFYQEFCEKPVMFVGGNDYCFSMESFGKMTQVALVGSYRYPFESSLTYFTNSDFVQSMAVITSSEFKSINMDALGGWITVMTEPWTLFSDTGDSICLSPTPSEKRIFCTFSKDLQSQIGNDDKWNYIVKVRQGCYSNVTVSADRCFPIKKANGNDGCQHPPDLKSCPGPLEHADSTSVDHSDPECMHLTSRSLDLGNVTPSIPDGWIPKPPPEPSSTTTTSTTTPSTPTPNVCDEITRETVKKYWIDPANNECGKSIVEAIFRDQLQRFAVTRFDKVFDSRLESLEQMKQLVYRSRDIIKKTCGKAYVPEEFLDVATEAFMMFISEDFFYGVEGAKQEDFTRILKSLEKCFKRAKLFVFETKPIACDLKKITGTLFLPGETVNITIPDMGKSKHFETLIETVWKMFLNSHSYCFEDFQFPNDHHLFSTLFLELFSRSIYEKWIEPLTNKQLYKLIVPHFASINDIMENLDYCVGAVKYVSKCPVWLQRSNPNAKPIEAGDSVAKNQKTEGVKSSGLSRRKKRSWITAIEAARKRAAIWGDTAYCLQYMEEPSVSLSLAGCEEVF